MAIPSVTYTFTNSTVADATEVNTNFSDLINALTDGTSDHSISTLTLAGALTANGNVTLGNASGDTMTVNATPTFVNATTFSSTTTFNGAPTFNAAVTVGAYDFTVNTDTFFVDASEDSVGIGTTSPSGSFHINTDPTGDCDVHFECAGGSDVNLIFSETDPTNPLFSIQYAGSAGSNPNNLFKIRSNSNGASGIDTDVITITQSGNVGIGTTSPSAKFQVSGNTTGSAASVANTNTGGNGMSIIAASTLSSDYVLLCNRGTSTEAFRVRCDGEVYAPRVYTRGFSGGRDVYVDGAGLIGYNTSALKYKTNLRPFNILDNIDKIRACIFDSVNEDARDQIGVIADDFVDWLPEMVEYRDGEVETVSYGKLAAVAFRACQELKAENDALKARLDALESI